MRQGVCPRRGQSLGVTIRDKPPPSPFKPYESRKSVRYSVEQVSRSDLEAGYPPGNSIAVYSVTCFPFYPRQVCTRARASAASRATWRAVAVAVEALAKDELIVVAGELQGPWPSAGWPAASCRCCYRGRWRHPGGTRESASWASCGSRPRSCGRPHAGSCRWRCW